MKFVGGIAAFSAAFIWIAGPAAAQDYPVRPVRAITPLSAGGLSDVFLRVAGDEFQKRTGQPLIVESRPGGAMIVGARACAEAQNDGYTICILPVELLAYYQFMYKKLPYDPARSFEPITNVFFATQVLVVSSALGVKSLDDLAAVSKAKAGTLSYTAPSVPHILFMEKFKERTGADLVRVPFKGGGDAVNGILSGTTPVAFFGLANIMQHLRSGGVTALAVDSDQRSPLFPEVPTLAEIGYRGDITRVYFGLVAPAGTPKPIIARLHAIFGEIGANRNFRDKHLVQIGLEPIFDTTEHFGRYLADSRAVAERVVKASGLEPQ
jgi:tripartite-type tricarboxylate transporter receptor subunit TctC